SDVVHQTLLNAHRRRDQCHAETEGQFRAWLRRILANAIADAASDLPRERVIQEALDASSACLEAFVAADQSSPSERAQHQEQLARVAEALAQLPEDERVALELRYLRQPRWPLAEIARHLNRPTAKAVAGLLARGLQRLRRMLA